jgi:hypothetical protein
LVFATKKKNVTRPEGGAVTARFLVLQHERRRRPALGPRANNEPLNFAFAPIRGRRSYGMNGDSECCGAERIRAMRGGVIEGT